MKRSAAAARAVLPGVGVADASMVSCMRNAPLKALRATRTRAIGVLDSQPFHAHESRGASMGMVPRTALLES